MAKSNQISPIQWAFIGIGAYLLFGKAVSFVANQFKVLTPRVNFGSITFQGIQANIIIPIQNNTPVTVPLNGVQGVIKYGQEVIGQVNVTGPIDISANSVEEIFVDFWITPQMVGGSIINLINSGNYVNSFSFQGNVVISDVVIPVNQKIPLL